ncbi:hypothetical protein [Methanosarcina sp. UBA289]|uniref:hypothetical protein n=1 Tax=Methanosarcina sp. UBA289 TaxID=1915574 RepID=UPI0025E796E7|nr:hypothetical protein [Methanosarcina sp. UBA289]
MLYCSHGVLDLEDLKDFKEPKKGFETNLNNIEKLEVEKGERTETFHILILAVLDGLKRSLLLHTPKKPMNIKHFKNMLKLDNCEKRKAILQKRIRNFYKFLVHNL